ncbi:MAG: hypothetical protein Q8L92_13605, partial [Rubrivivax sp.]|nr:hypothetical protein [Rubrivivax sp.]
QAQNFGHHDVVHKHRGNEDEDVGFQNGLIRRNAALSAAGAWRFNPEGSVCAAGSWQDNPFGQVGHF